MEKQSRQHGRGCVRHSAAHAVSRKLLLAPEPVMAFLTGILTTIPSIVTVASPFLIAAH